MLVCVLVFLIPTLYAAFGVKSTVLAAVLVGISHLLAGPVIGLVLWRIGKARRISQGGSNSPRIREFRLPSQLFHIVAPRDVFHLLLASIIVLPIAKSFSLLSIMANGGEGTAVLLTAMVLRDFAGVIAIAGPGIALSSPASKRMDAAVIKELILTSLVTAVLLAAIFGYDQGLPIAYLAMLPLYWSATRLPVRAAVLHAVLTSAMTLGPVIWVGIDPFAVENDSPLMQASAIQIFITMCVLLSLIVSTTVQQHAVVTGQFEALVETIPDALLVVDRRGAILPVNDAAYGVVTKDLDGEYTMKRLSEPEGTPLLASEMPAQLALRGKTVRGMFVKLSDPGAEDREVERYYSVSASPLQLAGDSDTELALVRYHDNTKEYWTHQLLRRSRDEARQLFEFAPQGVAILDAEGAIVQANRSLGELVGVSESDLVGRKLDEFSSDGGLHEEISAAIHQPGELVHADRCLVAQDGSNKKIAFTFRRVEGNASDSPPLLVNAVDVTERQKLHELVSHLAEHDSLTGLANRRRFEAELKHILERSASDDSDGALLLIDLDNFKSVNDLLGHQAGDELLIEFAKMLQETVRDTDVVGRFGGDEFVIILPEATHAAAATIGKRIIEKVRRRYQDQPNALRRVTASIGIAMFSEARQQSIEPIMLADQLLYNAKHAGRDRVVDTSSEVVTAQPDVTKLTRHRLEQILNAEAITLVLQPIAKVETGRVMLAEGLARVEPSEEPVATVDLIRAVEQSGLGPVFDASVLRKGIALLPELQRARPGFRLTLNLSAQSVGSTEISDLIVSELKKHRVPEGSLVLEVTETVPISDVAAAQAFQRHLREHGVNFALDDFGAGFDPYRILKALDFSFLKVAGEFVRDIAVSGVDREIVASLIDLAEKNSLESIAEHVSNAQILDVVTQLGATYVQGYHIGKPIAPHDFIAKHLASS